MTMGLRITRTRGQSILLSGGIRILFTGTDQRDVASVEVQAPPSVRVLREEIATDTDRRQLALPPVAGPERAS